MVSTSIFWPHLDYILKILLFKIILFSAKQNNGENFHKHFSSIKNIPPDTEHQNYSFVKLARLLVFKENNSSLLHKLIIIYF